MVWLMCLVLIIQSSVGEVLGSNENLTIVKALQVALQDEVTELQSKVSKLESTKYYQDTLVAEECKIELNEVEGDSEGKKSVVRNASVFLCASDPQSYNLFHCVVGV